MRKSLLFLICGLFLSTQCAWAEADPNFYIYLCFGQSNMEGNAVPEEVDYQNIDPRFQMMACVNFTNPARTMGQWYTAEPPLVRQGTGLGVTDYFGRTMVKNLPEQVKVGVVNVAIGGTKIEGFMEDKVNDYVASFTAQEGWLKNYFAAYDYHPYQRLVAMAKEAQKAGVIKGILLHQGESNNMQTDWPSKVKSVYNSLISDLGLNAADVPLFVGETVRSEMGGACGGHNSVIANVPSVIPNSYVISSANLAQKGDGLHFTPASYRIMGQRYAKQALSLMNIDAEIDDPAEETVQQGDLEIDQRFKSVSEIGDQHFAIVNENEHRAFYVEGRSGEAQILDYGTYDKALNSNNVAVHFALEAGPYDNTYLLKAYKMDGQPYGFWGYSATYLNTGNFSCFVLSLGDPATKYGQDIQDGAVWEVAYEDRGWTLKSKATGKYLKDTAKAEYETPAFFTFCTLKPASSGIKNVKGEKALSKEGFYTLDGRRVANPTHGLYITNGKKVVVK